MRTRFASLVGIALASLACWAGTARALHPDVEEGRRLAQEASFDEALAALDRAEASGALSREDLVVLLESRALVHHALGREGDLERTLRELASLEPSRTPGREVPPDLAERMRAVGAGARRISLSAAGARAEGAVTLTIDVRDDAAGIVREVRVHVRTGGAGAYRTLVGREHTVDVAAGAEVAWWTEAVGPGGAVVAADGSAEAPRRIPADVSPRAAAESAEPNDDGASGLDGGRDGDDDDGPGPWPYVIGASILVVIVGVIVAVLLIPGSDTIPDAPSHPL